MSEKELVTLTIDGQRSGLPKGTSILEAAKAVGIEIPYYCYHPGLSVVGNCRMCLVEIEKIPKLQPSCATPVAEGMVVRTRTPETLRNRQSVLEFLLLNHPLDCPVCDQAGECELQNYYMEHGAYDAALQRKQDQAEEGVPHRAARDARPGTLHSVYALRAFHPRNLQDRRAGRARPRPSQRDRYLPRRGAREPLLRQRRGHLPGRGADRSRLPVPVQGLVPGPDAFDLPRLQPRLQHRDPLQRALQPAVSRKTGAPSEASL